MTGVESNYKERQRYQVSCPECGKYLSRGSLATHCQTYNFMAKGLTAHEREEEGRGNDPRTYRVFFLTRSGLRHCPVEECSGQSVMRTAMRLHFWHRHVWDTVVILG